MCGIVGYIGNRQAAPILLEGLSKLEYRGYDSAGLAVRDGEAEPVIVKAKGRLKILAEKTDDGLSLPGNCGIGHTRWATHGEPSEGNAHPHCTDDRSIIGVHNGIIENYQELRDKLVRKGYSFHSQTDTEVAIKTVDYYLRKYNKGPIDAIVRTMMRVRGSYALAFMFKEYPGELYVARKLELGGVYAGRGGIKRDCRALHGGGLAPTREERHRAVHAPAPIPEGIGPVQRDAGAKRRIEVCHRHIDLVRRGPEVRTGGLHRWRVRARDAIELRGTN